MLRLWKALPLSPSAFSLPLLPQATYQEFSKEEQRLVAEGHQRGMQHMLKSPQVGRRAGLLALVLALVLVLLLPLRRRSAE